MIGKGVYGGKDLWKRYVLAENERVKKWRMIRVEMVKETIQTKAKKID